MSYCFFVDVLVHGWEECTCFRRRCVIGRGEERGCLRESWNTLAVIDLVQELEHCAVVIRIVLPGHKAPFIWASPARILVPKPDFWCRSPTPKALRLVPKPDFWCRSPTFGADTRLPKHATFGAEARLLVPKPDSQSTTFGAEARLLVPKPDSRSMLPLVPKPDSQSTTFGAEARLLVPKPDYLRHRIASRLRMICEVTWSDQLSRVGQAT
jgi:putative transposon-encoded protein